MAFIFTHQMATLFACLVMITTCSGRSYVIKANRENSDITCWTCPYKANNQECNNWAPDIACPVENTVCRTIHRLHVDTGVSVSVIKQCAPPSKCDSNHVGCRLIGNTNHMECVSCCDYSYCNVAVPMNVSTAFKLSASLFNNGASYRTTSSVLTWLSPFLVILFASLKNSDTRLQR